jgi:hypothetical protein
MTPKDRIRELIKKYWNAGMNNVYWNHIQKNVEEDIEKLIKELKIKS